MQQDYRIFAIYSRLSKLKLIIPIISPKGGVGKSTISSLLSLALSNKVSTGLLDLDITNPILHIILGIDIHSIKIEEEKGVRPVKLTNSLEFMSISFFTKDKTLPLRGKDIVNVIRELLAITNWDSSVLIIDTPPGFSDEILELLLILHNVDPHIVRPLLVTGQNILSLISIKRILGVLREEGLKTLGIVCNMCNSTDFLEDITKIDKIDILGYIPFIQDFENIIGNIESMSRYAHLHLSSLTTKILQLI